MTGIARPNPLLDLLIAGRIEPRMRKRRPKPYPWLKQSRSQVLKRACESAANGRAFLETDMRAHANPTRMENIRAAAEDLTRKVSSPCPACGAPGFWIIERAPGLLCEDCGAPTRQARSENLRCAKCAHQVAVARPEAAVPSQRCDYCNP